jgi:putative Holliday junction resolvase
MPGRTARKLSPQAIDGNPVTLFRNASDFALALPRQGSLLALDLSPRRIGLAGTDSDRILVTPLVTLQRRRLEADLDRIAALAERRGSVALVLGWPLNMDGSQGPACDRVRSFAGQLLRRLGQPLLLQDERLTSAAVERALEDGRYPRPRHGEPVDHLAAAVILGDSLRAMAQTKRS